MDMRKLEEQQLGIVKKYLTLFKPAYLSISKYKLEEQRLGIVKKYLKWKILIVLDIRWI